MDARNSDKLYGRMDEVEEVGQTVQSLIKKLIELHSQYVDMLEADEYPSKPEMEKLQATIKKVEKSLRIASKKLSYSYDRLVSEEYAERTIIKETLKN